MLRHLLVFCVIFCISAEIGYGKSWYQDSTGKELSSVDTSVVELHLPSVHPDSLSSYRSILNEKLDVNKIVLYPRTSIQQFVKGEAAGVFVEEPTGEPGREQSVLIHGSSTPLLSEIDLYNSQPLVVVNGVPRISGDHPFAYDLQEYDYARIGPATNVLADIQPDNIASVEVVKDPVRLAYYGPMATNGVIEVKTKQSTFQKQISLNSYVGIVNPQAVTTLNGASELAFRKPFYEKYATEEQWQNMPAYLGDSLYNIYYGTSDWTDLYYQRRMIYNLDASISGGSNLANFFVFLGSQRDNATADNTGFSKYNVSFTMNLKPLNWLDIVTYINASRLTRDRNRNLRDRYAEERYFPDLSNPISPNKSYYSNYLAEYDNAFDRNNSDVVNGFLNVALYLGKLTFNSRFSVDYSGGYRDLFYPSTLMETNSYVSNYFGFNRRLTAQNSLQYSLDLKNGHSLKLEIGDVFQYDAYRYSYGYAYRGTSDYIKINLLDDPHDPLVAYFSYQANNGFLNSLTYRFLDGMQNNLASFYGLAAYSYKDKYEVSAMVRSDGASTAQPTSRWFISEAVSGAWNIKNDLLKSSSGINEFKLTAGFARLGIFQTDDRFAAGPQYTVDVGYTGQPRMFSVSGVSVLDRPYTKGWVGYNLPWAYSQQFSFGVNMKLWQNRFQWSAGFYSRTAKNQLIALPAYSEYGYQQAYFPGMAINNKGVDMSLGAKILDCTRGLNWSVQLNANYNKNKLAALPNGVKRAVIGNQLLEVGKSIDQFWLYENQGIYNSDEEVPTDGAGNKLSLLGIGLQKGDPKWRDVNGDNILDENDKALKGHFLPVISGGFSSDFSYKKWTFNFRLYYNLGKDILNQDMANRFDFINRQSANDINSIKEITFWEKKGDYSKYPLYNPWSEVTPYRIDQDLFLENGSFLKIRSVSLGHDLTDFVNRKKKSISRLYVYVTANNLWTLTGYSGKDPELVTFNGYDNGYGLPLSPSCTVGVQVNL